MLSNNKIYEIMADNKSKNNKNERNKVNSSQGYEVKYLAEQLGVSAQAVNGAKRATGSNDRKVLEKYLTGKKSPDKKPAARKSTPKKKAVRKTTVVTEEHKIFDVTIT